MGWWFDRLPERYEFELQMLEKYGFAYSVKDDGVKSGLLVLEVEYCDWEDDAQPGRVHILEVQFPPHYPDFPFQILAPTFPPGTHLNPQKVLCLLQDAGTQWDDSRDFLAAFLLCQVKDILRAHRGDTTVLEAQEGLRQTNFIRHQPGSAMLVGDWEVPANIDHGYFRWRRFPGDPPNRIMRGAVTHLEAADRALLGELDMGAHWTDWLNQGQELKGRWVRLSAIPSGQDPLEEARSAWPELATMTDPLDLVGLLIPEERDKGGAMLDNWVFILRVQRKQEQAGQAIVAHITLRAEQFSEETKWARAPRAIPIAAKKVLLVGLGAVGAPLAWQLARAGIGTLWCVDYDSVQIGNLPRWLWGMGNLGDPKAKCVAANLQHHYPPLHAEAIELQVGSLDTHVETYGRFMAAIDSVDMIVDASAEVSVNRYLEGLARTKGIPYVWAYGTNGAWGGVVGRTVPRQTAGCYECFRYRLLDGAKALSACDSVPEGKITPPPAEDLPDVQPVGCFHPTFRGTGFDLDTISQLAARLVVATLCRDAPEASDSYTDFTWDIAVLSQWDYQTGQPTVPEWHTYKMERHIDCQRHEN